MKKILVIISLILGITAVNAQQAATQEKSGLKPYVGVEVGSSAETYYYNDPDFIQYTSNYGMSYAFNAGLMLNQYFGAEVLYSDLGKTSNSDGSSTTANTYGLLVKAQYPFKASKLSVYGKLGLGKLAPGYGNHSVSATIFGVGLGYQFMPQLQATITSRGVYVDQVSPAPKILFMSFGLGLNYSF